MKRALTVVLSFAIGAVGLWVMSGSRTLTSACTLSAHTGGGTACVSGVPFYLLGIALVATGVLSIIVSLWTLIQSVRHNATRSETSAITTLHPREVGSLREVA